MLFDFRFRVRSFKSFSGATMAGTFEEQGIAVKGVDGKP